MWHVLGGGTREPNAKDGLDALVFEERWRGVKAEGLSPKTDFMKHWWLGGAVGDKLGWFR